MPRSFSPVRGQHERTADGDRAKEMAFRLQSRARAVAITFVDHSGAAAGEGDAAGGPGGRGQDRPRVLAGH